MSQPGSYNFDMLCFRFRSNGPLGELRRSFIGDYSNYKDVRWIGAAQQKEVSEKVVRKKIRINTTYLILSIPGYKKK